MRVVRSPIAHGRLLAIKAVVASKMPGVHAVWTAADIGHIPPIGFRLTGLTVLEPYRQYVLARDRVRYVGEPVAAVFASDPYVAEDAAETVEIETAFEQPVIDAMQDPSPFDEMHSTEPMILAKGYGDVREAFTKARQIIELELSVGRHSGVPIETRGAIARYNEEGDTLELYGAAKVPHWNRDRIALMLGRKAEISAAVRRPRRRRFRHSWRDSIPKTFWSVRQR